MSQRLRIFISSPGDVQEERLRAHLVVQKLARDYARFFQIEAYLWEHEPMLASGHFQDAIELPSASDIMVLIVYSRLGTALPERSSTREYRGLDGRSPVTGTEWEFEEALQANRSRGAPDLLAYRKLGDPGASLADTNKRAEQQRQWDALQNFWNRHFETGTLFLAGSAKFSTLEEFDQKLEADLVALIQRRIDQGAAVSMGVSAPHWLKGSPFRGLASYDFADSSIFFGRDAQIRSALTRLQSAAESGCAFLLILGASGAGKSSVARAGILPALFAPKAIPGVAIWRRIIVRPGEQDPDPVMGLALALCTGRAGGIGLPELVSSSDQVSQFAAHLEACADNPSYPFQQALERVIGAERLIKAVLPHETARVVLLVDQLEELFTRQIDPARRALFIRILNGLARSGCVWVIATMRNDLWHRAVEVPQLVGLVEAGSRFDLLPPDGSQLFEMIRRPAAAAGLSFETDSESGVGLDAAIAQAAAEQPGALPLLSVMLDALYERAVSTGGSDTSPHQLSFAAYRDLGELTGAIARRADDLFNVVAVTDPEAVNSFPRLLRSLVTTSAQGTAITSRPAQLNQFAEGGPEARLIGAMVSHQSRLLVASTSQQGAEVRLAHEALIENWPRARDQIALDRRDLETRSRLETLLRRYKTAGNIIEQRRAMLEGLNLAEGSDLIKRWDIGRNTDLGGFVDSSERADKWRRRRTLMAAAVLLCAFASLAAVATIQWGRADLAAQAALRAEAIERDARAMAEVERNRATENERKTAEALRATQLETAQTLVAQVTIANGQHDVRRALTLAVQSATIEKSALRPGDLPSTEPALLQALAGAREVLHVTNATQSWWMPYAFTDDTTLVYADAQSGLIQVDLRHDPKITSRVPFSGAPQIRHLAMVPTRNLIVAALANELRLVDTRTNEIGPVIPFKARINSIDVDHAGHRIVVAAGSELGLIDIKSPNAPVMIKLPDPAVAVGQVRFSRQGAVVLATAGTRIFEFDVESARFADRSAELSGAGMGVDQATLQSVLAKGSVPFIRIEPDIGTPDRLFTYAPLELQAIDLAANTVETLRTDTSDYDFRGLTPIDQERRGEASTLVAVQSRSRDDRLDFQLRYVSGSEGILRGKDGRLLPPFASLSIVPGDFAKHKPDSCRVSTNATFLACQYSEKDSQGIVVWRLLGGDHVFALSTEPYKATSGIQRRANELLVSTETELVEVADGSAQKLALLSEGWRLTTASSEVVVAMSPSSKLGRIFRLTATGAVEAPSSPIPAVAMSLSPTGNRVLAQDADRLSLIDTATGTLSWVAPIGELRYSQFVGEDRAIAVASRGVYSIDATTGRILTSYPLSLAPDAPVALNSSGQQLAYLDVRGNLQTLDLKSGTSQEVKDAPSVPTKLLWSNNELLLIGGRDGSVMAWNPNVGREWLIASRFSKNFQASAWPGQPPQGVVLDLAVSHDGTRLAVVRQDTSSVDLYSATDGHFLTALTPPWSTLTIPGQVSFGPNGDLVTAWAFHAMTRDRPRYVTVHRLPRDFDEALAAARSRLKALNTIWSPGGPD